MSFNERAGCTRAIKAIKAEKLNIHSAGTTNINILMPRVVGDILSAQYIS
jgi:hypothetical protein